jgi:predicted RND superfamily exporter protein
MASCTEKFGNKVESFIAGNFGKLGTFVGVKPRRTIAFAIVLTALCGAGFARWTTENRADKLWVPQNTVAETETEDYQQYFGSSSRFNSIIVQANVQGENVLTKARLEDAMKMHKNIESEVATVDKKDYTFLDLCTRSGRSCSNESDGVCECLVLSVLKQWDYDLATLQNDADYMATLNAYGSKDDLDAVLGKAVYDGSEVLVSAEAFTLSYFIDDRTAENGSDEDGSEEDPINEGWEEDVFLATTESVATDYATLSVDYLSGRSFSDEFGGAITGDLLLVQISYVVVFLFLGASMGRFIPGPESRWTMSLAALVLVGLSTGAGFGLSSAMGFFFGPVHSLLPFILLGIGVDDAFVIVNAFNRERKGPRSTETNDDIAKRAGKAMARAGASITVTSLTDLVAFGISASSSLPALASFCAYAAVGIVFLWIFASTFFAATMVLDERRQRDNRRECLCCITRKTDLEDDENDKFEEDKLSRYFRNYHAPLLLSKGGKAAVLLAFSGLLGFGIWVSFHQELLDFFSLLFYEWFLISMFSITGSPESYC